MYLDKHVKKDRMTSNSALFLGLKTQKERTTLLFVSLQT